MLKYLDNISQQLKDIKKGVEINSDKWRPMPENPGYVQSLIDKINSKNSEIESLQIQLSEKYGEARILKENNIEVIKLMVKRVIGLHAENPERLIDYGIIKNNGVKK
jgi:hypothetical protein